MIAKYKHPNSSSTRAAKLSLLNFFSLFRDLHKSTRYSAGGVAAELFRVLHKPTRFSGGGGGGSSSIFQLSSVTKSHFYPHVE